MRMNFDKVMLGFLMVIFVAVPCLAQGWHGPVTIANNAPNVTNSATTDINLSGAIHTLLIIPPSGGAWTGTVAIATASGETMFTSPSTSATTHYRPRPAVPLSVDGLGLVSTNHYEMVVIYNEKLTYSVVSTSTASTNDIQVQILLVRP